MRFALGFTTGLIAGYLLTLVIWVRLTDYDRPFSHGLGGMEALAVAYLGLFIVAPLEGWPWALRLASCFTKRSRSAWSHPRSKPVLAKRKIAAKARVKP
jgi:hypothetical protein